MWWHTSLIPTMGRQRQVISVSSRLAWAIKWVPRQPELLYWKIPSGKKNRQLLLFTKPSPSPSHLNLIFLLPIQLGHDPIGDPASPDRLLSAVTSSVGNHKLLWSSTSYHLTFSRDSKENLDVCEFIAYVFGISFTIANEEYADFFVLDFIHMKRP